MVTHIRVEAELGQVVSWSQLPVVLQVETHSAGKTLWCLHKSTKCTLNYPQRAVINLETSDWKRPEVWRCVQQFVMRLLKTTREGYCFTCLHISFRKLFFSAASENYEFVLNVELKALKKKNYLNAHKYCYLLIFFTFFICLV